MIKGWMLGKQVAALTGGIRSSLTREKLEII